MLPHPWQKKLTSASYFFDQPFTAAFRAISGISVTGITVTGTPRPNPHPYATLPLKFVPASRHALTRSPYRSGSQSRAPWRPRGACPPVKRADRDSWLVKYRVCSWRFSEFQRNGLRLETIVTMPGKISWVRSKSPLRWVVCSQA